MNDPSAIDIPQGSLYAGQPVYKPNEYSGTSNIISNNNDSISKPQVYGNSDMYLAREISVTEPVGLKGKDILRILGFLTLNTVQIILISVSLGMNWINYCYWTFSLFEKHKIIGNGRSFGDDAETIDEFYDDVCERSADYFPECPDLCDGVDNLRDVGKVIYGLYIPSIIGYFIVSVIFLLAVKFKFSKKSKGILIIITLLSFIFFLAGFIAFYRVVDPDNNFKDTKRKEMKTSPKPLDFEWNTGLYLSIPVFIVEALEILLIYEFIYKFRTY